jgi:hypothetical protein
MKEALGMMQNKKQWLVVGYQPVSLFSLKRSDATNMAAATNLVPTPYAIKMALLRILIEHQGRQHRENFDNWIEREFNWIRNLDIFIQPCDRVVVNRNGYKIRYYDQTTDKADKKANRNRKTLPLHDGFIFREWVYLEGVMKICCGPTECSDELEQLLANINYFGKRGCLFQYLPDQTKILDEPQFQQFVSQDFIVQPWDDLGEKATFEKINPYSTKGSRPNKDRCITSAFLPLRLLTSSTHYDLYERS